MNTEKRIGKITAAIFGVGGYQDAAFGLSLTFESKRGAWGVGTFINGGWCPGRIDPDKHCQWTEEDRGRQQIEMCRKIAETLNAAAVDDVAKLVGKPVEVTFEGNRLKDWRILTEAI